MQSSLFCYAEPMGFLASRGYRTTCTRNNLILPCTGDQDVEYNDTPFAKLALSHALSGIERGLAPCVLDPGTLASEVPWYIEELGLVGYEADLAAAELFCSDETFKSDGKPRDIMFLVEAPPSRIDDHATFDDEGRMRLSGFDSPAPYYRVFDKVEVEKVMSTRFLLGYFSEMLLTFWDDGDFIFVSNTKSAYQGCPPNLKHLGLDLAKREKPPGNDTIKLTATATWDNFFADFEVCPTEGMLELLTKSSVLRKKFLELRNEYGPIEGRMLKEFRDKLYGMERAVSLPVLVDELKQRCDLMVMRFLVLMELRGLIKWSCGACHFV